jgi:hypothetical protein
VVAYDYRWGTSRWLCWVFFGVPVYNFVTGGFSIFSGYQWIAADLEDYPAA